MVNRNHWLIISAITVLVLDQIIKAVVRATLALGQSVTAVPSVLSFTRVHNTGAAFGIFSNVQSLVALLSVIIIVLLIVKREELMIDTFSACALGTVIGGALGNLIDRVILGHVVDYIDLGWWPAFNIADMGVVIGGILLVAAHLKVKFK